MSCAAAALLVALAVAGCGSSAGQPPPARAAVAPTTTPSVPPPVKDPPPSSAIVWGLERPARAARRLRAHPAVAAATPVGRGAILLREGIGADGRVVQRVRSGYAIPLDTLAVDPSGYAATLPEAQREPFAELRPGTAILSTTSAALRELGAGGELRLESGRLRVVGVVPDDALRSAEVALASRDRRVDPLRSTVIVSLRGTVSPRELIRRTERGAAARIVDGAGPAGPARPAQLKVMFGEPAVGLPYGDDWIRLDPAFLRRHIVTRRVPILGSVTCHRKMIPPLRAALGELAAARPVAAREPRRLRGLPRAAPDPAARPALAARVGRGDRPQRLRQPVHGPLAAGPPARPHDAAARVLVGRRVADAARPDALRAA